MLAAVTGAAGHLGANLVRALLEDGHQVRALINRDRRGVDGLDVETCQVNVLSPEALDEALTEVDWVFHLAGIISTQGDPDGRVARVNVEGSRNVAEASLRRGVQRFVHFSSIQAFDTRPGPLLVDEDSPRAGPGHPAYDRSKQAGEEAVRRVMERGLDAVVLNPTAVLGPQDFGPSRLGQLLLDLYHRRLPAVVKGGCSWVDVRDVAQAALVAARRGRQGQNYIIGGHWLSVRDFTALVESVTAVPRPRWELPMAAASLAAPLAMAWANLRGSRPLLTSEGLKPLAANPCLRLARAQADLGYRPRPLKETVADTYAWFDARGALEARQEDP